MYNTVTANIIYLACKITNSLYILDIITVTYLSNFANIDIKYCFSSFTENIERNIFILFYYQINYMENLFEFSLYQRTTISFSFLY